MAIELQVDANGAGEAYAKFWNVCVGAGRANEGLRAGWLEQLKTAIAECGFQYIRFHGLFHDDMFVYRQGEGGQPVYNFQYVNELFDRLLDANIRPFVEFGFCPGDLAREKGTIFWWKANGSPPTDYHKWKQLVFRTVRNWVDRYGIDEVRQWYFEVWNEPNLHFFFKGTKSEYFELYKVTVAAIKSVDARLLVGGPATSNFVPDQRFAGESEDFSQHSVVVNAKDLDALDWRPVWLEDFLQYCARERLPVDFVSCHPYPTDWALDANKQAVKSTRGVDATKKDLAAVRRIVDASAYPQAEIHLTEWNSSPSPRDHTHDHLQAATFVVKTNVESIGLVDSLSYWTFTDVFEENGAGDTHFHGGFGMINYQGIQKPAFHAYRMLNQLGNERLGQSPGIIATRDTQNGVISLLAYHYPPEMKKSVPASSDDRALAQQTLAVGIADRLQLRINNLPAGARFVIETLDRENGNALAAWCAIGSPEPMTREQTEAVRAAAAYTRHEIVHADTQGVLAIDRPIEPWSVVLIQQTSEQPGILK